MSGRILKKDHAKRDLLEEAWYIALDNPDAAERFLIAAEEAFSTLSLMPQMGPDRVSRNPAIQGLRMWPIRGFENVLIFYRPIEDGIEVIRVLHGARDVEAILEEE